MLLAALQNVTMRYAPQVVLRDVSLQISSGQRLGLIGPNGSGKTTILRLLTGREQPTEGNAVLSRNVRVGYVPQHVTFDDSRTVMEHVLADHRELEAALRRQEQALSEAGSQGLSRAMRAYQRAADVFEHAGGHDLPRRAEAMLDALGLAGRGEQKIGSLSGGEKNVLALTEALLSEPDLLLLDEPGNHLDYMGVAWLEGFLSRYKGAVLIVSHNRYLLDRIVGGIIHLENARVRNYEGNYSTYRANRLRHLIAQQADYVANQKRLAQVEALVKKFEIIASVHSNKAWGRRLRSRRKQLERERAQAVEKPDAGPDPMQLQFRARASKANVALQVRGYDRAFGDLKLFEDAELDIACGERVALVGPNGCGKTTLLRDIIARGDWEDRTIRVGPSLDVGYCAQEQEVLKSDRTIFDEIMATGKVGRGGAYAVLARFLFGQDDMDKRVSQLSGGERNRLQLARLTLQQPNFLMLDEPTNHLDIPAREAVEDALAEFDGTILVVSHDRYFLDKVVDRVVEVRDRKLVSFSGGFTEYWAARGALLRRSTGRVSARRKGRERERRRGASGSAEELERRIAESEREKVQIERRITQAFVRRDRRLARKLGHDLDRRQERLDILYDDWMATSE